MRQYWTVLLVTFALLTPAPLLFPQATSNLQFRETAVVPFFHELRVARYADEFQTIYKRDLNGTHTLVLVRAGQWPVKRPNRRRGDGLLGLFVMKTDEPDQVWELGFLDGYSNYFVEVDQADDKSILLRMESEEGTVYRTQLLFDLTSRRILQQFDPASKAALPFLKQTNPELVNFRTAYSKDVGGNHTLLLILAANDYMMSRRFWSFRPPSDHFGGEDTFWVLGLFLVKAADPDLAWELDVLDANPAGSVKVEQADDRSILLHFQGEKEATQKIKYIFDVSSRRLLKKWNTPLPVRDLVTFGGRLYAMVAHPEQMAAVRLEEHIPIQVKGTERDSVLARSKEKPLLSRGGSLSIGSQGQFKLRRGGDLSSTPEFAGIEERIGDEIKLYELPRSTFEELARYRPDRARPKYKEFTYGAEMIGPFQNVEDRFWFGKTFYDGEGWTGIGGFGYLDTEAKRYVLYSPPEIIPWSVSALFVDEGNIWLGLMSRGEWGNNSGGLLKYDRYNRTTKKFDLGESYGYQIIHQIKSRGRKSETYLATNAGLFIEHGGRMTRYFFEPMLDAGVEIIKNPP
jgi:hypothetical protein